MHSITLNKNLSRIGNFVQAYMSLFIFGAYLLSVFVPQIGIYFTKTDLVDIHTEAGGFALNVPMISLSIILFNAVLCIKMNELKKVNTYLPIIFLALSANFLMALAYMLFIRHFFGSVLSVEILQHVIIAIAILSAVPIAGTASAWTQSVKGNVSITLGMILLSTIMCPFYTPIIFKIFSGFTNSVFSEKLLNLTANGNTNIFLMLVIFAPVLFGLITYAVINKKLLKKLCPLIKVTNQTCLLVLCYSNASVVLPDKILGNPNIYDLSVTFTFATIFTFLTFMVGWVLSRLIHLTVRDEMSLMFSEGLKNIGAAMVLASFGFPEYKNVTLFIIFFALTQQLVASYVKPFELFLLEKKHKRQLAAYCNKGTGASLE